MRRFAKQSQARNLIMWTNDIISRHGRKILICAEKNSPCAGKSKNIFANDIAESERCSSPSAAMQGQICPLNGVKGRGDSPSSALKHLENVEKPCLGQKNPRKFKKT